MSNSSLYQKSNLVNIPFMYIASVICLLLCMLMAIIVFRFRPLLGDDILFQYLYGASNYLDDKELWMQQQENLIQMQTLSQSFDNVVFNYMTWGARIIPIFLFPMLSILGKNLVSIIAAISLAAFVLSIISLTFSDWRKALRHPILILWLFYSLVFFHRAAGHYFMWTFITCYVIPNALYLLYLYALNKMTDDGKFYSTPPYIVLLNLLGLITGLMHEMLGAVFVLMLVAKGITLVFQKKSCSFFHYARLHIGFLIGYCIVFFAPANFYRVQSIHSATEGSYIERLINSFIVHIRSLFPTDLTSWISIGLFAAIIVLCLCFCVVRIIKQKQLHAFISENLYIIVGLLFSPILFALGPYTPTYGTGLWNALFYVLLLRAIYNYADITSLIPDLFYKLKLGTVCTVLSLSLFILLNAGWFHSFISISLIWEKSISQAKLTGESTITVPLFVEGPNGSILFLQHVNNPDRYETLIYKEYYGIQIIPE